MAFDIAAFFPGMPDNLPPGSIEGLSQCHIGVLMCIPVDHDLISGNVQIDSHIESVALMFVEVWLLNRYVAAGQIGMQLSERLHFFPDVVLECHANGHSMK